MNANAMHGVARSLGFEVELRDGEPERKFGRKKEKQPKAKRCGRSAAASRRTRQKLAKT